jgi:hypothetical protein
VDLNSQDPSISPQRLHGIINTEAVLMFHLPTE